MMGEESRDSHVDHGYAWVVLAATVGISMLSSSFFASQSVYFTEFMDYFQVTKAEAAVTSSLAIGISGMSGILFGSFTRKFGERAVVGLGSCLAFIGMVASVFAPNLLSIYVLFGAVPGLGVGCYAVGFMVAILRWFKKRRSLALGIQAAGLGVGTFAGPQVTRQLINNYGWRGALLVTSAIQLHGLVFGALLRPLRTPNTMSEKKGKSSKRCRCRCVDIFDWTILKNIKLVLFYLAIGVIGVGHMMPYILLPARAISLGTNKNQAVYLVSIMGLASGVGRPLCGIFGDLLKSHKALLMAGSAILVGTLNACSYWLTSFLSLAIYSGFSGAIGAGHSTVTGAVMGDIVTSDQISQASGFMMFTYGTTSIITIPLAGLLVDYTGSYAVPFPVFGGLQVLGGVIIIVVYAIQRAEKKNLKLSHLEDIRELEVLDTTDPAKIQPEIVT